MGLATSRLKVGTWVAHIYLRLPYLCAKAAALAGDATGGRFILGLGVSHQPVNRALGIDMPNPSTALRNYAVEVVSWLHGDGPATHLPQQPSLYPVPLYLAALTSQNIELAGEIADGVMPLWWSVDRVARSRRWIERGRAKSGGRGKLDLTLGLYRRRRRCAARRRPGQSEPIHHPSILPAAAARQRLRRGSRPR